jgi:hypothetical protein
MPRQLPQMKLYHISIHYNYKVTYLFTLNAQEAKKWLRASFFSLSLKDMLFKLTFHFFFSFFLLFFPLQFDINKVMRRLEQIDQNFISMNLGYGLQSDWNFEFFVVTI